MEITATHINYYKFCKRQLWLSLHYINMEQYNEDVLIGKLIEESSFKRRSNKNKQIELGSIKIDYLDKDNKIIYETKKSSRNLESAIWQMKYYLYILNDNYTGIIEIPKEKKKEKVILTDDDVIEINTIIMDIEIIKNSKCPKPINNKKCKKCSFNEYCYS